MAISTPVRTTPLEDEASSTRLSQWLRTLSDSTRRAMLRMLMDPAHSGMRACEFEEHFAVEQSTISYHLKALLDAGLIERHKSGARITYHACRTSLAQVLSGLAWMRGVGA